MEMTAVWEHLYLVLVASIFTTIFGLTLGITAYLFKPVRSTILWIVDILQTIPVLALLGIIMLVTGATSTTVIIGIVLYSLLPVVRNTLVGLEGIDPGVKEAALGIGMSRIQRLIMVELPLAFPMFFTGIRIAIVTSIGIAVFGYVVGGGGLGETINKAMLLQDKGTILQVSLILMGMAIVFDIVMTIIEKKIDYK